VLVLCVSCLQPLSSTSSRGECECVGELAAHLRREIEGQQWLVLVG
jgi:hypothetical protein